MTAPNSKELTLADLPNLRRRTESTAQLLRDQLLKHLEVLRPLLAPERLLGKLVGVKTEVIGADVAYAELQKNTRILPINRMVLLQIWKRTALLSSAHDLN